MNRQLKYLFGLFFVLAAIAGIVHLSSKDEGLKTKRVYAFEQKQVESFKINHFTQSYLFKKLDGLWQIKRAENQLTKKITDDKKAKGKVSKKDKPKFEEANSLEVTKALTYLINLEVREPIATATKKENIFEINPYALHVIFYDGEQNELGRLYIGKQGPDLMSSYVSEKSLGAVYLVEENFKLMLLREYEEWIAEQGEKV